MNGFSKFIIIVIVVIGLGIGKLAESSPHAVSVAEDTPSPTPEFVVSQQLLDAGATIGLSKAQLQSVHAQADVPPYGCDPAKAQACYFPGTDTIYIYPSAIAKGDVSSSLAYEWFHHFWANTSSSEQESLHPDLDALYWRLNSRYDAQQELQFILGEDSYNSPTFYDEMQSLGCTETYHLMGSALQTYCRSAGLNLQSIVARYQ